MSRKPTRKITLRVSPQTAYNLELLMAMSGSWISWSATGCWP